VSEIVQIRKDTKTPTETEMNIRIKTVLAFSTLVLTGFVLNASAKDIPAELPDPDGKRGDATKPVKVYILAGQSNICLLYTSPSPRD